MALKSIFPKSIYLGAATRSPIGRFGGTLKPLSAPALGVLTLKEAMKRAGADPATDFVFVGHARQAGAGPNPARQIAIGAGLGDQVPALTLNQACASGMAAILSSAEKIALGKAASIWAGGVESMSNTPYFLPDARFGMRLGHGKALDGMWKDGFFCPMSQMVMGETVERFIAREQGIGRDEQDAYALESQTRAETAWAKGAFSAETFLLQDEPTRIKLETDEHRRSGTTLADLRKLPAVFDPKSGTLTAGNSSGITDGAAFVHVSDQRHAHAQAELLDYETVALDPRRMGLGPIDAVKNLLKRHGLQTQDLEAVELNEAFAAQVIACQRVLKIPPERLNPRGGAIAIGHPIGATGTRITVTLIHQLVDKPGALGVATLCVSGGMGVALLIRSL